MIGNRWEGIAACAGLAVAAISVAGEMAPPPHHHVNFVTPTPAFGPEATARPSPTSNPALESMIMYCYRDEKFQGRIKKVHHAWKLPVETARWLVQSFRDDAGGEREVVVGLAEGDFLASAGPGGQPRHWAYIVILPKIPKIIHVKMSLPQPTPGIPINAPPEQNRF